MKSFVNIKLMILLCLPMLGIGCGESGFDAEVKTKGLYGQQDNAASASDDQSEADALPEVPAREPIKKQEPTPEEEQPVPYLVKEPLTWGLNLVVQCRLEEDIDDEIAQYSCALYKDDLSEVVDVPSEIDIQWYVRDRLDNEFEVTYDQEIKRFVFTTAKILFEEIKVHYLISDQSKEGVIKNRSKLSEIFEE